MSSEYKFTLRKINVCFFWKSVLSSLNLFYLTCLIDLSSRFSPMADSFQQSLQVMFRYNCKQFQFKNISEREPSLLASNQDKSPGPGILQTMLKEDIQGLKYYPLVYLVISIFSTANRWVDWGLVLCYTEKSHLACPPPPPPKCQLL